MKRTHIQDIVCSLVVKEGVSRKTNKDYRMVVLEIPTDYGTVDVVLNTHNDKAGIVLDMMSRKEVSK